MNKKIILGHRGYSELFPENTKLSFDKAFLFNFDGVEIDVHQTKDKKLVIIHDETIERTSNGKGFVKDFTLKELQKYDFGCKFHVKFPFQKILTYEEFLKNYGNKFKYINTEIKTDKIHYSRIEKQLWKIHEKINPSAKIIYSSFNFESLRILRKISEKARIGFLFKRKKQLLPILNEVKSICNYLHPKIQSVLKNNELSFYKKLHLPINVWTINKKHLRKTPSSKLKKLLSISEIFIIISNLKISQR